jgi:hypothetical protein
LVEKEPLINRAILPFIKIWRGFAWPTLIGIASVFGLTLFWLMQSDPYLEPSLFNNLNISKNITSNVTSFSKFIGFGKAGNLTQWQKAFERSFADFIPLLPLGSKSQVDWQTVLSKYWVCTYIWIYCHSFEKKV